MGMDLSPTQQAVDLIRKSKRIGILIPEESDLDQFASAQILGKALNSLDKSWEFIFQPVIKEAWKFLPLDLFKKEPAKRNIVIAINTAESPIGEIRYEKKGQKLEIIISPQSSPIKKENISIEEADYPFDLLITIGVSSLDKIGESLNDPNLIFDTPLINIDRGDKNENFGEINIVEKNAVSNSAIIFNILRKLDPKPVESDFATMILAGIADKTIASKAGVPPEASLLISELKARGGDLDQAISHLPKLKPLNLLKLWGRASVRSKKEDDKDIFWSFITAEDFEKTSTGPDNVKFVLDSFEEQLSLPKVSAFLWQHPEQKSVHAILRIREAGLLAKIEALEGTKAAGKLVNLKSPFVNFKEAETKIRALLDREI